MNKAPRGPQIKLDRPHAFKINFSDEEKEALNRMIKRTGKNGAELIRAFVLEEP